MRCTLGKSLGKVEVVAELLCLLFPFLFLLIRLGLRLHFRGGDDGILLEVEAHDVTCLLTLAYLLGYDVLGSLKSLLHVLHALFFRDELLGFLLHVRIRILKKKECSKRFKSLLTSNLCLSLTLRLVREVDVLQLRGIP